MKISDLKNSEEWSKLPDFIKYHSIWGRISSIEKPFSSIGLPNSLESINPYLSANDKFKNCHIGFSSEGIEGLWDLATMSMRGVYSCMHWGPTNTHKTHLVGSVTDPFLGIVYITDNKNTEYGKVYARRSLVRFCFDVQTKKYSLSLERVYKRSKSHSSYEVNKDENYLQIESIFSKYLNSKLRKKIKVFPYYSMNYSSRSSIRIPSSYSSDNLDCTHRSMIDSCLIYGFSNDAFIKKFSSQQ